MRGALLTKDYGVEVGDEYIVMEVVDNDLWWRMKSVSLGTNIRLD